MKKTLFFISNLQIPFVEMLRHLIRDIEKGKQREGENKAGSRPKDASIASFGEWGLYRELCRSIYTDGNGFKRGQQLLFCWSVGNLVVRLVGRLVGGLVSRSLIFSHTQCH